jgi:hypothetical protein
MFEQEMDIIHLYLPPFSSTCLCILSLQGCQLKGRTKNIYINKKKMIERLTNSLNVRKNGRRGL